MRDTAVPQSLRLNAALEGHIYVAAAGYKAQHFRAGSKICESVTQHWHHVLDPIKSAIWRPIPKPHLGTAAK